MENLQIAIIAAVHETTGIIGQNGRLPWKVPEDMENFRELTMGSPIIFGRKTWELLPGKLHGRKVVVLSKTLVQVPNGVTLAHSIDASLAWGCKYAYMLGSKTIFIGGGAKIYHALLPRAEVMYLTVIGGNKPTEGDTYFPEWRDFGEIVSERILPSSPLTRFLTIKRK
ncbi:MAG: hypothetical protein A2648_01695 [Candidatus Lloydbacteria bacterium RIFCSPHIGHO2_01_FULL_41_20]|uniref:dihydrofolate reductase n=1 Tax=Candidatus Lloydbacteria bacterium RIFCSPHIGHO2_01_FULL_41_20 TaxID=1798657 RepID=A0A1G2CSR4_9BACT|nr:MAG: hypothetical protein A2648_01695 [Candidatus Lloydbacteria bacterium RIFCSPHIGHO2_01_FULL_41_20]